MEKVFIVCRQSDYFDYAEVIYGVFKSEKKAESAIESYMKFNKDTRTKYTIKEEFVR